MEVINKTFAGTTRAGRCGCVCRSSDNSYSTTYNTGYASYGCHATCYSGNTANYNTNWSDAVNHN